MVIGDNVIDVLHKFFGIKLFLQLFVGNSEIRFFPLLLIIMSETNSPSTTTDSNSDASNCSVMTSNKPILSLKKDSEN